MNTRIKEKSVVIELIKDVTNSMFLQNGETGYESKMLTTIENMNQMVIRDGLTKLYNRRFIEERLSTDLVNASLNNEPLSIIFVDLDYFKSINSSCGNSYRYK